MVGTVFGTGFVFGMRFRSHTTSLWIILWLGLISGCSTLDVKQHYAQHTPEQNLTADYYQIDIPSHDGITLKATLYQPALAPGETAPLIIHAHGFGVFRMPRPMSVYGQLVLSGEAALKAWESGRYWLISFDQRGFGDSEGDVEIMSVDHEVKDVSAIIDWAEASLPQLARDEDNDIVVGMVGESYGGGAQLLASIFDERIDAIVPITTWHNLAEALAPNGHVRTAWGGMLLSAGTFSSFFDFGKAYASPYLDMFNGKMNVAAEIELERRSPSSYCANGQYPQADMLLVQGFRDTVFPVNHAYQNWLCGRRGGVDARLVAIQGGHILPWPIQSWSGIPFYNTEDRIRCGEYEASAVDMILSFLDEKLRGESTGKAGMSVPRLCLTVPEGQGLVAGDMITGGDNAMMDDTGLSLIHSGWFEVVMQPVDRMLSLLWRRDNTGADFDDVTGGNFRPAFRPLRQVSEPTQLVGIPRIRINMETTDEDQESVVFVGVGVRRQGQRNVELVSEQLTPLPGDGRYDIPLAAVSTRLGPGDQVGLVMQGFSGQFFFNPEGWFESATLSGEVALPLDQAARAFSVADHH